MEKQYLIVPEVAEMLSVAEKTMWRWLRNGRLKGVLLSPRAGWRVRPESVAANGRRRHPDLVSEKDGEALQRLESLEEALVEWRTQGASPIHLRDAN